MMTDGEARTSLQIIASVFGDRILRKNLLELRRDYAAETAKKRIADFRAKLMAAMEIGISHSAGDKSPYEGMREPLRGPAIPVPYQRTQKLAPCWRWQAPPPAIPASSKVSAFRSKK